jgi:hypothetical protein
LAYTVLDLTSAVQDDLKDPSFSSSRILRYLNYGQKLVFNTHAFRFCEEAVSGDLTVGEHSYQQQTNHQSTIGGALLDPDDFSVVMHLDETTYLPHRDFFDQYPSPEDNDNARPSAWTEYGDEIFFNCPVDEAYIFRQRYYRYPAELTSDSDVPTVPLPFRELLEQYAIYRGEKYRGNHDFAATYKQDFEDGLEAMVMRYSAPTQVAPARVRQRRTKI